MKNTKIKFFLKSIPLIILCIVIGRYIYFFITSRIPNNEPDGYDKAIEYLSKETVTDIVVYGDEIAFRETLEHDKIKSLKEVERFDADYVYLVINDLNGNTNLTKEDIIFLKQTADQNVNFNFIYVGTDKLELFFSGIFEDYSTSDDDFSFSYVMFEGSRLTFSGAWTEDDEKCYKTDGELLGAEIVDTIALIIATNE